MHPLDIHLSFPYFKCNYNCTYCIIRTKNRKKGLTEKQKIKLNELFNNITTLPYKYNVTIETCGEPLISDAIIGFIKSLTLSKNIVGVNITTNLSISQGKLKDFIRNIDSKKLSANISYHPDSVNNFEEFVEKILYLLKYTPHLLVVGVAHPDNLKHLIDAKKILQSNGILMSFNPMRGYYNGKRYPESFTKEESEQIKGCLPSIYEWDYRLDKKVIRGNFCYAGLNSIHVDLYSNVYRCRLYHRRIRFLKLRIRPFYLGKLKKFHKLKSPMPCVLNKCHCPRDWTNTKEFTDKFDRTISYRIYFDKESRSIEKTKYTFIEYRKVETTRLDRICGALLRIIP